ncbi:hypothetical protein IAR55_003860 [Kwoniella newhampshirensis]|uniref:Nucleoprotein TPR/MLP1 domain-containing protein n=1 Tax=Kwoniella newhampshirensis TaxID=1651941 RepID=A0AAW0YXM8_9TREE
MSFIGSGELEHKITQLQRQLDHKDHELSSIKNEQRKKAEDLAEAKRAKEGAEYKLRDEADRAHQAETAVSSKTTEISQLKLKLSNLEASLTSTADKLKKEEREKERISDALDAALSSGSDGAAKQVRDSQAKIKQLEESLKRAEEDKERARSQSSSGDVWGSEEPLSRSERNRLMALQNENVQLKATLQASKASSSSSSGALGASSASPSRSKGKRRSMSVSAAEDVRELETQVDALKEQLVNAKRDFDKAVNEKLAVEMSTRKKTERLENELDEVRGELNYYRNADDGTDSKELERVKKTAQAEKEELSRKLREKEAEVEKKAEEVARLEKKSEMLDSFEAELERERQTRQLLEAEAASAISIPLADEDSLAQIRQLEAELTKARSASNSSVTTSKAGDSELRQVRRELQKAIRDKEYLDSLVKENDELLAEKDEEITRLKTAIPMPGSPSLGPAMTDDSVAALQEERKTLHARLEEEGEKHLLEIRSIEEQLEEKTKQLDDARSSESDLRRQQQRHQDDVEALTSKRAALDTDLKRALENLAIEEGEVEQLNSDLTAVRSDLVAQQIAVSIAQQEVAAVAGKLQAAEASLIDKEQILLEIVKQRDELMSQLATRSHQDDEFDALAASVAILNGKHAAASEDLAQVIAAKTQIELAVSAAEHEKVEALQQVQALQVAVADARLQVEDSRFEANAVSAKAAETIQFLSDQVNDLNADLSSLRIQLDDKTAELVVSASSADEVQSRFEEAVKTINTLQGRVAQLEDLQADRSTESEARERDEQLFQIQEEKRNLQETLSAVQKEYEAELASITFKSEQDIAEAQKRVAILEKQVSDLQASLASAAKDVQVSENQQEVRRLEDKIGRLRAERDDLRHNVSFVQNERHFAIRAANEERESAIEEVRKARDELKQRNSTYENLQMLVEELRKDLEEQTSRVGKTAADADSEKLDLVTKVTNLESELVTAKDNVASQRSHVAELEAQLRARGDNMQQSQAQIDSLQKEVSNLVHHLGQTAKLSDPPLARIPLEEDSDLPTDLAQAITHGEQKRPSHTRSRSSVSSSMLQNLNMERNLQAKIERRDARIATLTNDLNKAKSNLALLQEAQEETLAENSELEAERDQLQAQIGLTNPGEAIDDGTVRGLVIALALHHRAAKDADTRWRIASDALQKSSSAAEKMRDSLAMAEKQSLAAGERADGLEAVKLRLDRELGLVQTQEQVIHRELDTAQSTINQLQDRISAAEAAGAAAAEYAVSVSVFEVQIAEREERIRELKMENIDLASRLESVHKELADTRASKEEDMIALLSKIAALQQEVADERIRISLVTGEKQQVLEEIGAAEKALEDGLAEADVFRQKMRQRQAELESSVTELQLDLEKKSSALIETAKELETLQGEVAAGKRKAADITTTSQNTQSINEQLRADISVLQEAIKAVEHERESLKEQMIELRAAGDKVGVLTEEVEEAKREKEKMIKDLEDVASALTQAKQNSEEKETALIQLQGEVESKRERGLKAEQTLAEQVDMINKLTADLHTYKQKLDAASEKAEVAVRESNERQSELDTLRAENEKVKVELSATSKEKVGIDQAVVEEMRERIEGLEASLTQKNKEVDEADDQTREAFKTNAKLEKKIGKLQRQLEQAKVDANTAINKAMSSQPIPVAPAVAPAPSSLIKAAPAPVPTRSAMPPPPIAAPTSVTRTPLANGNIFGPVPLSAHKRHREVDETDSLSKPAEAIMQPPTNAVSPRKVLGSRTSFTPQRSVNAFAPKPMTTNPNVVSSVVGTKENRTMGGGGKSIFAKPIANDIPLISKPAFPLPPTRNPFGSTTTPRR